MTWILWAIEEPVLSHSGPMDAHTHLVDHVQQGYGVPFGWFSNPKNQASSTWWIGKDGTLVQFVDSDLIAWAQSTYNGTMNSVETEGYDTEPLTNPQILTFARLYVEGHKMYGWPLVVSDDIAIHGLITHGDLGAAGGNHPGCPGDIRKAQRGAVIYIASLVLNPPVPSPPPSAQGAPSMFTTDPISGHAIGTDADGNFYGGANGLVIVTLGQHPAWKAGEVESAGQNPCVGIAMEQDADGTWGYTYFTKPTTGSGSWGPYNRYHINRNGTF